MDDGSGNRFGRHLLRGYYFNKMPMDLAMCSWVKFLSSLSFFIL
jgi:hypothetical protein